MSRDSAVSKYPGKYPDGYIPKIKYWISKMDEEVAKETPSIHQLESIQEKLRYFIGRQKAIDPEYQPIQ